MKLSQINMKFGFIGYCLIMRMLLPIRQTDLEFANQDHDIRGARVVGVDGRLAGYVTDLVVDVGQRQVRFLIIDNEEEGTGVVKCVPVESVAKVEEDTVALRDPAEKVGQSPVYHPALVDHYDYQNLYRHFRVGTAMVVDREHLKHPHVFALR